MSMPTIRPITPVIGAEVHGVDLSRPLAEAAFADIVRAWHQHLVLVFPGQALTDPQLERFSARFGPLDRKPV